MKKINKNIFLVFALLYSFHLFCPDAITQTSNEVWESIKNMHCTYCHKKISRQDEHRITLEKLHTECVSKSNKEIDRLLNNEVERRFKRRENKLKIHYCSHYCIRGIALGFISGIITTSGLIIKYWEYIS